MNPTPAQPAAIPAPVGVSIAAGNGMSPAAARQRHYDIFELPEDVPIDQRVIELEGTRYAITEIWFALLSLKEDKLIAQRAGDNAANAVILAMLKTTEAMRFVRAAVVSSVIGADGQPVETFNPAQAVEFATSTHDASAEGVFGAMHPGLRDVVMLGYATSASMSDRHAMGFLKSRRTAIR